MIKTSFMWLLALAVFLSGRAAAQQQVEYSLTPITESLYSFVGGPRGTHIGAVLVTEEGIVVADTMDPESSKWLRAELKSRFDQPVKYVIFSHSHYDHIGGSNPFKDDGATIIAHENVEQEILWWEEDSQRMTRWDVALPDVTFSEKLTLKIGKKTINLVYLGPGGHTDSLAAVQFVEDRTVMIVDAANIKTVGYKTLGLSPLLGTIRQLRDASALEFDHVLSGHPEIGNRRDLEIFTDYISTLADQVGEAIKDGKSLEETQQGMQMDRFKKHLGNWDAWFLLNVQGAYEKLLHENEEN